MRSSQRRFDEFDFSAPSNPVNHPFRVYSRFCAKGNGICEFFRANTDSAGPKVYSPQSTVHSLQSTVGQFFSRLAPLNRFGVPALAGRARTAGSDRLKPGNCLAVGNALPRFPIFPSRAFSAGREGPSGSSTSIGCLVTSATGGSNRRIRWRLRRQRNNGAARQRRPTTLNTHKAGTPNGRSWIASVT